MAATATPQLSALQAIINEDGPERASGAGWQKAWDMGVTPWDLGGVHPVVKQLVETDGGLPSGRILVPGCGSGYDVLGLAGPTRHVVGLDLAETASAKARELARGKPNEPYVEFVTEDFFQYQPSEPFAAVFDYTFFCALGPTLWQQWAQKMADLIAPGGELITLMFPMADYEGGPPYAVSPEKYEAALKPVGFQLVSLTDVTNSVGPRLGKEKLGLWRRVQLAKV